MQQRPHLLQTRTNEILIAEQCLTCRVSCRRIDTGRETVDLSGQKKRKEKKKRAYRIREMYKHKLAYPSATLQRYPR